MQAIPFSETISSYCKQFFLMDNHSFKWKQLLLLEAFPSSGSHDV